MRFLQLQRVVLVVASAASLLVLAGCTPPTADPSSSPSSSPEATAASAASAEPAPATRPALADLELSPAGLGTLLFGVPPETDPELSMIFYNLTACIDAETGESFGIVAGDPLAPAWLIDPSYEVPPSPNDSGKPFGVAVDEAAGNAVFRIDLYTDDIPTDAGIRLGDTRADVVAAYPSAVVTESYLTDIYVITGPTGLLQIEVVSTSTTDKALYWDASGIAEGLVLYIHAVTPAAGVFSVAASGNSVGGCNFG